MDKLIAAILFFVISLTAFSQTSDWHRSLRVGSDALHSSLKFQLSGTDKASLPVPKMTTTNKNAIATPTLGAGVWDTTLGKGSSYTSGGWDSHVYETLAAVLTNKSIDADTNTITNIENADIKTGAAINAAKIADGTVSSTEFQFINSVTSNVQTQIDGKQPTGNYITALTGDVTASGPGSVAATIANNAITGPEITNGAIDLTTKVTAVLPAANGGTGASTLTANNVILGNGTSPVQFVAPGISGNVLKSNGTSWISDVAPGGSGSGGINYIGTNFNAEDTTTTGWSCYADAAAAAPVDGTGGSPNTTFTNVASATLSGARLFRITKSSGASRQGEGCAYAFTIDSSYKAKVLRIQFPYISSANIIDGDYRVYIYDVTNSRLIDVDTRDISANSFGHFIGSFQTSSDSTSYRLIIHTATASTTAATLDIDDVVVGPQTLVKGPIISDWASFTPTGSWSTNTTYTGKRRRVGDSEEYEISIALAGAPTTADLVVNLPSGSVIDTNKLSSSPVSITTFGIATIYDNTGSATGRIAGRVDYDSTGSVKVLSVDDLAATDHYLRNVSQASPITFAADDMVTLKFRVPIVGWQSTQTMSEDGGTRKLLFRANRTSTAQTISSAGTSTVIVYNAVTRDDCGGFNTSSGVFTVCESGDWVFACRMAVDSYNNNEAIQMRGLKNGSTFDSRVMGGSSQTGSGFNQEMISIVPMSKGDTYSCSIASISDASFTVLASDNASVFSGYKIATPQTLAGGDSVYARGASSSGQTISTSTTTAVTYNVETSDSHSSFDPFTGIFTAPSSGLYSVKGSILFESTSWTAGTQIEVTIVKNSTDHAQTRVMKQATTTAPFGASVSDDVRLAKGDTITLRVFQDTGSSKNLNANATHNFLSIVRVGN